MSEIIDNDEISYAFNSSQEIIMDAFHKKKIFVEIGDFVYQPTSLTFLSSGRITIDIDEGFEMPKINWED